MSKAFLKETDQNQDDDDDGFPQALAIPAGAKNYITPAGYKRLNAELLHLLDHERPQMTAVVSWAAKNGDRSENGDYLYGKKRLREIDRRIRFLNKRIDNAEVIDPTAHREPEAAERVYFGATVSYLEPDGTEKKISIVGLDELDLARNYISWISPLARALIKAREGDAVLLRAPSGNIELEVTQVAYLPIEIDPFVPIVLDAVNPNSNPNAGVNASANPNLST